MPKREEIAMNLTEEDRNLVREATEAFGQDHRYLEAILWAAQARKTSADKRN